MTIEGIPEGWEPVRIGTPFIGERYIGQRGSINICRVVSHGKHWVIVRKIETPPEPKQYRPFKNAAEAEPFWDRRLQEKANSSCKYRVSVLCEHGCRIGSQSHSYKDAFETFECEDKTPFGVEIF